MRLATLLFTLLVLPATAQTPGDYAVFASQADLDDGGTLTGTVPTCLLAGSAQGISGAFFWDATAEVFAIYDASAAPGERTTLPTDPTGNNSAFFAALAIDTAAGTNVTTCRDAVPEIGPDGVPTGVAFLVLSNADNEDFVMRVDAANQTLAILTDRGNTTDTGDGIAGVAQVGETLYLARQQFFGAPEDGIYTIDTTTEDQVPTALVTDPDLDLTSIVFGAARFADEGLYAVSSEFGEGTYENVVLYVNLALATPELEIAARPCEGPDPVFTNCDDGGLEDLAAGEYLAIDILLPVLLVSNNSFSGPEGETVAQFLFEGGAGLDEGEIIFTEAGLTGQTGIAGFTTSAPGGVLSFADASIAFPPTLYLAGSDAFDGTPGIYSVVTPFLVDAEEGPEGAFALAVAPNPSVGAARLTVTPGASGALTVDVVDALGRSVGTLFSGDAAAGQTLSLTAPRLAPGVYTVRVQSAAGIATERFTVAR